MSATVPAMGRSYAVHGVRLEVSTDDPAVLEAMDLRLRGFTSAPTDPSPTDGRPTDPAVRLVFTQTQPPLPRPQSGRPVYETRHGTLHYFPERDLLAGELGGVALHCRPAAGHALIAAEAFTERSLYFATHPVATVALMELMERAGRFSLHAGCLADADGNGLLLCGPSGAGKSTLTLALALAGMGFLGDDVVFLERPASGPGAMRACGFADAIGLGTSALRLFPELASAAAGPPAEGFPKRLLRCEELLGRAPVSSCTPRVIVFPEVAAKLPSAVTPMDRGEALLRLVPDVLLTDAASTQGHIEAIAALLGQVRCYAVRSGYDLERAAEMVRELV
jgi:hypothetical protein